MSDGDLFVVNGERLLAFEVGKSTIEIGRGEARYRMKRGSFKTKDVFAVRKTLTYVGKEGDTHVFADADARLEIEHQKGVVDTLVFTCTPGYNRMTLTLESDPDECFYGCGEQFTRFNLKGTKVPIWVSEHHALKKLIGKFLRETLFGVKPGHRADHGRHQSYYAQPTFVSSKTYFIHCETDRYAEFTFAEQKTILSFRDMPKRIVFASADDHDALSTRLAGLLGKHPPLPDWTQKGAILASQGGWEKAEEKLKTAERNGIPVSAIWAQDWCGHVRTRFGYQVYWNWEADEGTYPEFKTVIAKWRRQNIRFLGYINTFLKEDAPLYREAVERDYLVRTESGEPYHVRSTTFNAGIVDLTCPDAFAWMKSLIKKNMIETGMAGWMADFGEYLPTDARIRGGDAEALHNVWPSLWARCNKEAILESGKADEVFFFSRAAHTDTIRETNTMWAGDQHVDFSDEYGLPSVIPAMLSMAMSGAGVSHSDIGGYTTIFHMRRGPELMMRWAEMNAFTPLFRTHEGNAPEKNCQFDDERVIAHFAKMARVFAALEPYRREVLKAYQTNATPVNRPLLYHFKDRFTRTEQRAFTLGADVLVYPVVRAGVSSHRITLPEGTWVHLFSGNVLKGGDHDIAAPLGTPSVFYRKDSRHRPLFETFKAL